MQYKKRKVKHDLFNRFCKMLDAMWIEFSFDPGRQEIFNGSPFIVCDTKDENFHSCHNFLEDLAIGSKDSDRVGVFFPPNGLFWDKESKELVLEHFKKNALKPALLFNAGFFADSDHAIASTLIRDGKDADVWLGGRMIGAGLCTLDELEELEKDLVSSDENKRLFAEFNLACGTFARKLWRNTGSDTKTYIMLDGHTGYYKIGRSKNPKFREKTLLSQAPLIELKHVINLDVEKQLHERFASQRVRGEWFELFPGCLDYIEHLSNLEPV